MGPGTLRASERQRVVVHSSVTHEPDKAWQQHRGSLLIRLADAPSLCVIDYRSGRLRRISPALVTEPWSEVRGHLELLRLYL